MTPLRSRVNLAIYHLLEIQQRQKSVWENGRLELLTIELEQIDLRTDPAARRVVQDATVQVACAADAGDYGVVQAQHFPQVSA
ncbi:MAG: hypothetical protein VB142_11695 [Burkholderia sp.]